MKLIAGVHYMDIPNSLNKKGIVNGNLPFLQLALQLKKSVMLLSFRFWVSVSQLYLD